MTDYHMFKAKELVQLVAKAVAESDAGLLRDAEQEVINALTENRWLYRDLALEKTEVEQRCLGLSRIIGPMIQALVEARKCIQTWPSQPKAGEVIELINRALAKVPTGE